MEDQAASWVSDVASAVAERAFPIVGCTTMFAQTNASIAILRAVKSQDPEVVAILGGANCEGEMALGVASLDPAAEIVDYVFAGESDDTFVGFLRAHRGGAVAYKRIVWGTPCTDLDALPTPDFGEYFEQLECALPGWVDKAGGAGLMYETSRGCWWGQHHQCTFCGLNGEGLGFREKSPERAVRDLALFADTYPAQRVFMTDSIMPPRYLHSLVPQLAEVEQSLSIAYASRANLNLAQLVALKNAGIDTIQPGVEAFDSRLLAHMNKGTLARNNLALLRDAKVAGVGLAYAILWGFPGDDVSWYERTLALLPLLRHLPPPASLLHLSIERFSPYFTRPDEFGLTNVAPLTSYSAAFPPHADSATLACHFVADYDSQSHAHLDLIAELAAQITDWQASWDGKTDPQILHLVPAGEAKYLLIDTRGLPGTKAMQVLDEREAVDALTACPLEDGRDNDWAINGKIGVTADNWYVPLATAEPELLLRFQEVARARRADARVGSTR
jgi:ribosomal peptide maturation radical SAM protein 1